MAEGGGRYSIGDTDDADLSASFMNHPIVDDDDLVSLPT